MATSSRSDIRRLDRLGMVRETMATVAEARVREAEAHLRTIQLEDEALARKIQDTRAETAQSPRLAAGDFQRAEQYIQALKSKRLQLVQSLENAKARLAERHQEWMEARREQKIIEKLQDRRLQEVRRHEDIEQQKSVDEAFIARLVRTRNL